MPEQNWRVNVPFGDHADRTRTDAIFELANETFQGFGQANRALQDPSIAVIGNGSGAATGGERRPINQRACNITVRDSFRSTSRPRMRGPTSSQSAPGKPTVPVPRSAWRDPRRTPTELLVGSARQETVGPAGHTGLQDQLPS